MIFIDYDIGMSEKQEKFTLLNGRVSMTRSIYNPTSDAVWLAAFAPKNAKKVLDVGIGTGGVSLCLLAQNPKLNITGIDISDEMLDVCRKNAELNNHEINLLNQDIFTWSTPERFDLVITNPPYFFGTPGKQNAQAHHNVDISTWVKKATARVDSNGYFCIIVDALCMDKVINSLAKKHFGDIQVFPLFGAKNTAERLLIRAKQGAKTGSTVYCGTSMNNDAILRDGLTIDAILSTLVAL